MVDFVVVSDDWFYELQDNTAGSTVPKGAEGARARCRPDGGDDPQACFLRVRLPEIPSPSLLVERSVLQAGELVVDTTNVLAGARSSPLVKRQELAKACCGPRPRPAGT